jgi:probable phosphoglycerate mutase
VFTPGSDGACVVLVRHGETEWSLSGRHTSVTDVALTARGREQARRIGQALAGHPFTRVLSSPRRRALDTAAVAGYAHPEVIPALVEWDYGRLEGLTTAEIAQRIGHPWSLWSAATPDPVPAETAAQVGARADAVIGDLRASLDRGEDAIIFAHAHCLRVLAARWIGMPATGGACLTLGTGSISELGYEHGLPIIARWNMQP